MTKEFVPSAYADLPNLYLGTLLMYMRGFAMRERLPTPTFYRHRKIILDKTGIDIGIDNIQRLETKPRKPIVLQPITAADMPDWYILPEPPKASAAK